MTRYIAIPQRPKAYESWEDQPPIAAASTVYEQDDRPEETGLVDAHGVPLYRVRDKIKMGFL